MEKRETVKIECSHMGGLMLNIFTRGRGEFGEPTVVRDGPGIRLNGPSGVMGGTNAGAELPASPGITEIDAEWWSKWREQNTGKNPLLDQGVIREFKENPTS